MVVFLLNLLEEVHDELIGREARAEEGDQGGDALKGARFVIVLLRQILLDG